MFLRGKGKGKAAVAVKAAPAAAASSNAEVDKSCPKAGNPGVSVCNGHDVKLNQTNIANNNNKFYILQVQCGSTTWQLAGTCEGAPEQSRAGKTKPTP